MKKQLLRVLLCDSVAHEPRRDRPATGRRADPSSRYLEMGAQSWRRRTVSVGPPTPLPDQHKRRPDGSTGPATTALSATARSWSASVTRRRGWAGPGGPSTSSSPPTTQTQTACPSSPSPPSQRTPIVVDAGRQSARIFSGQQITPNDPRSASSSPALVVRCAAWPSLGTTVVAAAHGTQRWSP